MAKPRNKYLDYIVYVAFRLFAAFVTSLPLEVIYRAAGFVGDLIFHLDRRHRRRAIGHLQRSFPDWPQRRVRQVAQASMRNLAYLGVELLLTTRMITLSRWRRHIRLHNMDEALRLLIERKTGLILLTGHFGNWEVLGFTIAALGFPNDVIARPLDNPHIDSYIRVLRQKRGLRILDKKGATRRLDDILDGGGAVSFIADQDAGAKGVFVDFFSRPASTYKSIALMAMRHQTPIIIGYGHRLDLCYRFELGVEQIIYPHHWADQDDPLRWITRTYTAALERIIRRDPAQYLWAHRRWKHRPPGEAAPEDGIA